MHINAANLEHVGSILILGCLSVHLSCSSCGLENSYMDSSLEIADPHFSLSELSSFVEVQSNKKIQNKIL